MIELSWQPDPSPQKPEIIIGFGETTIKLYQALRVELRDSAKVLFGQEFLALKADFQELPWVDGVGYLSACCPQSTLYLPTNLKPNMPYQWLEDYFSRPHNPHDTLYWPSTQTVIHADRYWSAAVVKQNHLLDLWYEHCSETLTALDH